MTKFEDEIILTPVVSGITVSVISSVVTAPSVGMAVVSIVPGFGAGIGISISGSFDNMLRFWLLFFGRSLPPVSVRVSIVLGLWAGFGLRLCHDSGSSESYEQQQLHFG